MRIAVGGLHVECCTYNPVLLQEHDFTAWRGAEMLAQPYFDVLRAHPAEYLPTFYARAVPGGPISRATYEAFKADFLERLRALGPIDALYLAMHGAAFVEGMEDAEGDWIGAARQAIGARCLLGVSYDMHGSVSRRTFDAIDLFSTYRTAPHIDVAETQLRTLNMLDRALRTGVRPKLLWVPVPLLLSGEKTSTVDEPARTIWAQLPDIDAVPGVWDASLQVGYLWADEPRGSAAAILTGTDAAVLEREAVRLARSYWDARHEFRFGSRTGTVAECVAAAKGSPTHPVILAESGDNPTAGGVGDRAEVLAELLRQDVPGVVFAAITDPPATAQAFAAGVGARLRLRIGGALDPSSRPVEAEAEVIHLQPAGRDADREAVVRVGGVTLVLAARRRPYHNIADFQRLNLDPRAAEVLVVKSGYLSPELAPLANPNLMMLSDGAVNQNTDRLARRRKLVPTFPFDPALDWTPAPALSARSVA